MCISHTLVLRSGGWFYVISRRYFSNSQQTVLVEKFTFPIDGPIYLGELSFWRRVLYGLWDQSKCSFFCGRGYKMADIDPFFLVYISIIHIYGAYLLNVWSNARLLYACIGSYFQINKSYWKQICVIVWSILRELPSLLGSKTQIKDWWHDVTATVLCCSKILSFHVFICCSGSDRF